jgi:hypothetical protein
MRPAAPRAPGRPTTAAGRAAAHPRAEEIEPSQLHLAGDAPRVAGTFLLSRGIGKVFRMPEYIRIKAIDALTEHLEYGGGGVAAGQPVIMSVQADYLIALSSGIPLGDIRLHRVLPLRVTMFENADPASFQNVAEILIKDVVPALDADFISSPPAEVGSISWRPAIRTKKRYTAKELAEWEEEISALCKRAAESKYAEEVKPFPRTELGDRLFKKAFEAEQAFLDLPGPGNDRIGRDYWDSTTEALERKALAKLEMELRKAEFEMEKAKYESRTALFDAIFKLTRALMFTAASCMVLIGTIQIHANKFHHYDSNNVHVSNTNAGESHAWWADETSEILKKLAGDLDSK